MFQILWKEITKAHVVREQRGVRASHHATQLLVHMGFSALLSEGCQETSKSVGQILIPL